MRRMKIGSRTWHVLSFLLSSGNRRTCEIAELLGISQKSCDPMLRAMQQRQRITKAGFGVWAITKKGKADMLAAVVYKKQPRRNPVVVMQTEIPLWSAAAHDRRRAHRRLAWSLGVAA